MTDFSGRLLDWYEKNGRHDLPWQRDPSPYRVWVSEIMLQQTQVATVIPYFERFMARFGDLPSLAGAPIDEVLGLWSGLGYYARARNLHAAARLSVERHGGELPTSREALEALPGIGRSTAAAILALAHGERHAILDGNVKRVLARFHAVDGWPGTSAVARRLWDLSEKHLPEERVASYTQAIMDLGATLCTRARPRCDACPVSGDCAAHREGREAALPAPRPKRARAHRRVSVLVIADEAGAVLLERRPPVGIWGGLYSFPELVEGATPAEWCGRHLGAGLVGVRALATVAHSFTHFDLDIEPLAIDFDRASPGVMDRDNWLWYKPGASIEVGVPAPIASLLASLPGQPQGSE